MKICPNCNVKYETGKFCNECGTPLIDEVVELVCKECGAKNPPTAKFCNECGASFAEVTEEELKKEFENGKWTFTDPVTNKKATINMTDDKAKRLNADCEDDEQYINLIKNWDCPAWLKDFCEKLVTFTVDIGKTVCRIGKWILNTVKDIVNQIKEKCPNLIIGSVIGFVFGLVLHSIPVIGWVLGPVIIPVFTVAGGILGFLHDEEKNIENSGLAKELASQFMNTKFVM